MAYKVEHREDGWAVTDDRFTIEGEPFCMVDKLDTEEEGRQRIAEYERDDMVETRFWEFIAALSSELGMSHFEIERIIKETIK